MTVGEALGAGLGAVGTFVDCALGIARRLNAPFPAASRRPPRARAAPDATGTARRRTAGEVEEAKYYLGHSPEPLRTLASDGPLPDREPGDLPHIYGRDTLVLLPRDPWWVFAYWEVTPTTREQALRPLGDEADGARDVLRVYDVTFLTFTGDNAWFSFDVELLPSADHWYLNVSRPAASYLRRGRPPHAGSGASCRSPAQRRHHAARRAFPRYRVHWVRVPTRRTPRETAGPTCGGRGARSARRSAAGLDGPGHGSSDAWAPRAAR